MRQYIAKQNYAWHAYAMVCAKGAKLHSSRDPDPDSCLIMINKSTLLNHTYKFKLQKIS